jgi:hypothetical protein
MVLGIGLTGVLAATMSASFVKDVSSEETSRLSAIEGRLDRIETLLASRDEGAKP